MEANTEGGLSCGGRDWARASLLTWDEAAFGFRVGELALVGEPPRPDERSSARASLLHWVKASGAELVSANVGDEAPAWCAALATLDFRFVDASLLMSIPDVKRRRHLVSGGLVRRASPADAPGLVAIAATAFDFGRYHRDALFPRNLADRRFAEWVRRAMAEENPSDRFFAMGPEGKPWALAFAGIEGPRAVLRLAGVAREHADRLLGPALFEGTLAALEAEGARSVTAKISAANTAALNLYAGMGFTASHAGFTYHWGGPRAVRAESGRTEEAS